MIEKGEALQGEGPVIPLYQAKLFKMDEELAIQQDHTKELHTKLEDIDYALKEEKEFRASENVRLRGDLKAIKEAVEAQAKLSEGIKKDVEYLMQAQKAATEAVTRLDRQKNLISEKDHGIIIK